MELVIQDASATVTLSSFKNLTSVNIVYLHTGDLYF